MSSTTNTFSTPTSTADAGGGDDGSLAQRGANYFFGFLITFVVLLLVFVGCGIGTRRRYLARRQAALFGNLDPWGSPYPTVEQKEPLLYEHHIGEPRLDDKWVCTKPLSLTLLRQPKEVRHPDQDTDLEANTATVEPQSRSNDRPHNIYPRALTSLMIPFHERKQSPAPENEHIEYGGPDALNIAVMIAMPSPHHPHFQLTSSNPVSTHNKTNSDSAGLPDVQIGVATLPWRTEIETGAVS